MRGGLAAVGLAVRDDLLSGGLAVRGDLLSGGLAVRDDLLSGGPVVGAQRLRLTSRIRRRKRHVLETSRYKAVVVMSIYPHLERI